MGYADIGGVQEHSFRISSRCCHSRLQSNRSARVFWENGFSPFSIAGPFQSQTGIKNLSMVHGGIHGGSFIMQSHNKTGSNNAIMYKSWKGVAMRLHNGSSSTAVLQRHKRKLTVHPAVCWGLARYERVAALEMGLARQKMDIPLPTSWSHFIPHSHPFHSRRGCNVTVMSRTFPSPPFLVAAKLS